MNNKTRLLGLYSESILLFNVQCVLVVIISHNQALMKVREERTLTHNNYYKTDRELNFTVCSLR